MKLINTPSHTPWHFDKKEEVIFDAYNDPVASAFEWLEDAESIVKAVNYHDRLVEALKECVDSDSAYEKGTAYHRATELLNEIKEES